MDVKEVLNQTKLVISVVDKWDDTAIAVLKSIASLPFAPVWLKTAAFLIEKYEKAIIEKGKATIDFIQSLLGGMEKAEVKGETTVFEDKAQKSEAKLNMVLAEVKPLLGPSVPPAVPAKVEVKEEEKEEEDGVLDKIQGVTEKVSGVIGLINSFKNLF